MSDKENLKESKRKNRFTELLDALEKERDGEDSLSGYRLVLDSIDESDDPPPEPIPFPYGGNSDFGKWVTNAKNRTSGWRSTATPF